MRHSQQRYLFIDLLRFLAVVFMIQGHTFDALLDMDLRTSTLFYVHDFFHGFVAPMFLFASGVAFGISTLKKWEQHISVTKNVVRRFGKFAGLIAIGYALHLPYFSLKKILAEATPSEMNAWLQVDALHCIAVSMILLQTAVLLLKNERKFILCTAGLAVAVILLSPIVWNINSSSIVPLWLLSYVNAGNNSLFPLFPWSAYIFCGVIFSSIFLNAKEHRHAVQVMQKTVSIGIVILTVSLIALNIPTHVYPPHDIWKVNPLIFFTRMGFVLLVASGLFFAEHAYKIAPKIPQIMGRESLFIYIVHLVIIYGSVINKGLKQSVTPTFSVVEAGAVFIVVFGIISLLTFGWHRLKKEYAKTAMATRFVVAGTFIFLFFTREY